MADTCPRCLRERGPDDNQCRIDQGVIGNQHARLDCERARGDRLEHERDEARRLAGELRAVTELAWEVVTLAGHADLHERWLAALKAIPAEWEKP